MKQKPVDKGIVIITALICAVGLVMVFSASFPYSQRIYGTMYSIFLRQAIFCVLGFICMLGVSFIPYQYYQKYAFHLWILSILLAMLVFTPLGTDLGTFARRWIRLGSITFMPSDILKVSGVMMMAAWITKNRKQASHWKYGMIPAMLIIGLTAVPIALQPDTSTMLIAVGAAAIIYILFAIRMRYFLPMFFLGAGSIVAFIVSDRYRIERIQAMLNPLADYYGSGWQLSQSLFAISAGGLFGRGLGKSIQKFSNLSEAHNDFIFAVLSEELGFIGACIVIFLFVALVNRMIRIAFSVRNPFARMLAIGISGIIALQAMINIAVAVGLIPPTGVTLPFISYGGTSLMIFLMMVGVVLQISRHRVEENHESHS